MSASTGDLDLYEQLVGTMHIAESKRKSADGVADGVSLVVEDSRQIFRNNMKYINSPSSYHGIQDAFKQVYKGALDIH
ncbi:hypothetical protein Dimus_006008 [Dionaea muscipula]